MRMRKQREGLLNKKESGLIRNRNRMGYVFIAPLFIGLITVFIPAFVSSFIYSFSDVKVEFNHIVTNFVGWDNFYNALFENTEWREILVGAVKGMLLDTLIILLFSFFIATMLNQKFLFRGVARTIFFLPIVLSTGIVATVDATNMLTNLFQSSANTGGAIASAFESGGISAFFDLEGLITSVGIGTNFTQGILYAIKNTYSIVNSSGVQILIFLSALQSISPSIFEAAKVEGATKWEEFWKITFPMLTPMILVNIVYTVVDSFTNPQYKVLDYIQNQAFNLNRMGFAAALSWLYFVIVLVILGVIWLMISKRIKYLD